MEAVVCSAEASVEPGRAGRSQVQLSIWAVEPVYGVLGHLVLPAVRKEVQFLEDKMCDRHLIGVGANGWTDALKLLYDLPDPLRRRTLSIGTFQALECFSANMNGAARPVPRAIGIRMGRGSSLSGTITPVVPNSASIASSTHSPPYRQASLEQTLGHDQAIGKDQSEIMPSPSTNIV